jgi:methyltransferase (TIGR00027 family)
MTRAHGDVWNLATGAGATATFLAAIRALASRDDNPLVDDPFAEPLVRAVGVNFFTRLSRGDLDLAQADYRGEWGITRIRDMAAIRTRFYDVQFMAATNAGIRQAVILASGLDSRAYRLPWPAGVTVYEIDHRQILEFKSQTLAELGAVPTGDRRTVSVDLRDDWPAALMEAGFEPTQPAVWSAEGLLLHLPADAQDALLDNITMLSAAGSRLATEDLPDAARAVPLIRARAREIIDRWQQDDFDIDLDDLWYPGDRNAVIDYLGARGWETGVTSVPELFAAYGLPNPTDDADEASLFASRTYVSATRI